MSGRRIPNRFVVLGLFALAALLISLIGSIINFTFRSPGLPQATLTSLRLTPTGHGAIPDAKGEAPVVTAPFLRLGGWSSDGAWLAYWLSSPEDVTSQIEPWPPASLAFYNPLAVQDCPHPDLSSRLALYMDEWTEAGEAVVRIGGEYYAVQPCSEPPYSPLQDFQLISAPAPDPSVSPGGDIRAISSLLNSQQGVLGYATSLVNTADSRVVVSTTWQIDERLGDYSGYLGGEWLSSGQFLIHETLDQGPLILDPLEGRVVPVLQELFGQEEIPSIIGTEGYNLHSAAIPTGQGDTYHLLLYGVGQEGSFPDARLYHAESGQVETLPYRYPYGSGSLQSPDGEEWLLMDSRPTVDGYETHAINFRGLDQLDGEWRLLAENVEGILWNGSGSQAVIAAGARLDWLTFPGLERLGSWLTRPYVAYPAAFSPESCWLAAVGSRPGEAGNGLFLLPGCPVP